MRHGYAGCLLLALAALLVGGCGAGRGPGYGPGAESPWPCFRGTPDAVGGVPEGSYDGRLEVIWETRSNDKPAGPLSISRGTLIYPGTKKKVKFLDLASGRVVAVHSCKGQAQTGVTVLDSLAYYCLAPYRDRLKCLNLKSNKVLWKAAVRDAVAGMIVVEDLLLVGSSTGTLTAYDPLDGSISWQYSVPSPEDNSRQQALAGLASGASYGGGLIFLAGDAGTLSAVDPSDGSERYHVPLGKPIMGAAAVSDYAYVADLSGNVRALDPRDGSQVWSVSIAEPIWGAPAVAHDRVFCGSGTGSVVAFDAGSGEKVWRFDAGEVVKAPPIIAGNYVVVGTMGGTLLSIEAATGRLEQRRQVVGAIAQSPVTDGQRVYVATQKGRIVCCGHGAD